jgi:hypothetical protein
MLYSGELLLSLKLSHMGFSIQCVYTYCVLGCTCISDIMRMFLWRMLMRVICATMFVLHTFNLYCYLEYAAKPLSSWLHIK